MDLIIFLKELSFTYSKKERYILKGHFFIDLIIFLKELSFTYSKKERYILKGHFFIDQNLPVLIPESYNSIQEFITQKSELDHLFSHFKKRSVRILDNFRC